MSDTFWKRLSVIAGLMAIATLFCTLIFVANLEIKDLDLWLHIGVGRYIVQNAFDVPGVDILSCTIAGQPWVNHEWLFQVVVYWISTLWGAEGLINMQVVLVAVTMMILLLLGYNKDKQLGMIFMLILVGMVYQGRFTIRPDLYSLLFFALYIYIMSLYLDRKWSLYALVAIQVLWSNMHGFFFFGPLFILIGLAAEWGKRHLKLPYEWNKVGRLTNDEYHRMKWILVAVVLACLVNPLTFRGAWYPIGVLLQISGESKIFFDKIVELKRPIPSLEALFVRDDYVFYKLLILLSGLSFVFNRRKLDIGVLFFWVVFLLFSLTAVRNLTFFAFAAYLVFVTNALNITMRDVVPVRITDRKFIYIASTAVKAVMIIWLLQYLQQISTNGYFDFEKYERKSEFGDVSLRNYPYKAVQFLRENKVKGNFFNDFNSGAYLVGQCFPDIKVFIDGRTEVYGPKFFKYYQQVWEESNVQLFQSALDKFGITGILLNTVYQPVPGSVLTHLQSRPEWVPVYFDFDGLVFLKDVPANKEVIEKYRIDFTRYEAKQVDLKRLGARNVTPYQNINRAYSLESMGYMVAALAEAQAALDVAPNYTLPYKLMGKIYGRQKQADKAFYYNRIAAMLSPKDEKIRTNLALAYYDLGEYKYAIDQFQRCIEYWPKEARYHYLIARAYVKNKQPEEAVNAVRKGFQMDSRALTDMVRVGELLIAEQEFERAREVLELALQSKIEKNKDSVYLNLGKALAGLGDNAKATEYLTKGLELAPENARISTLLRELSGPAPEAP